MPYTDQNTPVIEGLTLPSGTSYYIADREIRNKVQDLADIVAGGVQYIIAWDGSAAPDVTKIPAGIKVTYSGTEYTGTLAANSAVPGAFYLVKSATTTTGHPSDIYDEYIPVGASDSKTWEKIGDTQVDLSDVVTEVVFAKNTDSVIGSDSTFTVTQPTITPTLYDDTATGRVGVLTGITPSTTNISASAAGGAVSASGDDVTVVTGYASPVTDKALKTIDSTTQKLAVTTVIGVSGSTTASKATAGASQTTATGAGTATNENTDWIKGMSVANGILSFGAATLNTQTTTQFTFGDVTVPVAAADATTVATGGVTSTGSGADIITSVSGGTQIDAMTGLGSASTDTVLGTASAFNVTNPTISLASGATAGDGVVNVATGVAGTSKYLGAAATGANVAWNSKDAVTVLTDSTAVNVTKGK